MRTWHVFVVLLIVPALVSSDPVYEAERDEAYQIEQDANAYVAEEYQEDAIEPQQDQGYYVEEEYTELGSPTQPPDDHQEEYLRELTEQLPSIRQRVKATAHKDGKGGGTGIVISGGSRDFFAKALVLVKVPPSFPPLFVLLHSAPLQSARYFN